jgi:hypothetical protein
VADAVVGALHEGAGVVVDASREEQADLVDRDIVVATEVRRGRLRLRRIGVGEGVEYEAANGIVANGAWPPVWPI